MHRTLLGLAAAALLCLGAAPAHAQTVSPEHADDLLSLGQRQAIAEIRQNELGNYVHVARKAGIFSRKIFPDGTHSIKPLAEWTQADFERFKYQYDRATPEGLWGKAQAQVLFGRRAGDLSGEHESRSGGSGGKDD